MNLGILVSGESDDFGKAVESGCSVDPFDSGEYFDSGGHGSYRIFGETYHS